MTLRDLDLECLLFLLQPERIEGAARACVDGSNAWSGRGHERVQRLLENADLLVAEAPRAPSLLRDRVAFYDPSTYRVARESISAALDLISAGAGSVLYNIAPIRYDVRGVNPSRRTDLIDVTGDASADLFRDFYLERLLPELERDRPDVIGISILNHQQTIPGLALARLLKSQGYFVVIGGTVYTKFVRPHSRATGVPIDVLRRVGRL